MSKQVMGEELEARKSKLRPEYWAALKMLGDEMERLREKYQIDQMLAAQKEILDNE